MGWGAGDREDSWWRAPGPPERRAVSQDTPRGPAPFPGPASRAGEGPAAGKGPGVGLSVCGQVPHTRTQVPTGTNQAHEPEPLSVTGKSYPPCTGEGRGRDGGARASEALQLGGDRREGTFLKPQTHHIPRARCPIALPACSPAHILQPRPHPAAPPTIPAPPIPSPSHMLQPRPQSQPHPPPAAPPTLPATSMVWAI